MYLWLSLSFLLLQCYLPNFYPHIPHYHPLLYQYSFLHRHHLSVVSNLSHPASPRPPIIRTFCYLIQSTDHCLFDVYQFLLVLEIRHHLFFHLYPSLLQLVFRFLEWASSVVQVHPHQSLVYQYLHRRRQANNCQWSWLRKTRPSQHGTFQGTRSGMM